MYDQTFNSHGLLLQMLSHLKMNLKKDSQYHSKIGNSNSKTLSLHTITKVIQAKTISFSLMRDTIEIIPWLFTRLFHNIPGFNWLNFQDALSTQIIIPQKQVGRKSDIYVTMVSTTNQVCKDFYNIMFKIFNYLSPGGL